jgi:hypothetical protein
LTLKGSNPYNAVSPPKKQMEGRKGEEADRDERRHPLFER